MGSGSMVMGGGGSERPAKRAKVEVVQGSESESEEGGWEDVIECAKCGKLVKEEKTVECKDCETAYCGRKCLEKDRKRHKASCAGWLRLLRRR